MTIVKFPFSNARGAWSRMPRLSKNGTPEERAAKLAPSKKSEPCGHSNPLRAKIVAVSRAATVAGRVNYQSRDLSRIGPLGERHSQELRSAAKEARYLASEFERAAEQLAPSQAGVVEKHRPAKGPEDGPTFTEFLQNLKAYFVQEFARGKDVDQIFDDLKGSYSRADKAPPKS